jgi:hypothetical protein
MSIVVSVDPGIRECGVARFLDGELFQGKNLELRAAIDIMRPQETWIVELPRTYGGRGAGKADANDLIAVARVVGSFEGRGWRLGYQINTPTAREWNGGLPKEVTARRVWSLLSSVERARLEITPLARKRLNSAGKIPESAMHVTDAAGIGLWHLGRLPRRRTI